MTIKMSGTQARAEFAQVLNRVTQADEILEITRYATTEAYLISSNMYERLTRELFKEG